jgi:uncharacterized membrane protein
MLFLTWRLSSASVPMRRLLFGAAAILVGAAAYILFKQMFGLRDGEDFVARGFAERMLITQALFLAGWLLHAPRVDLHWLKDGQQQRLGAILTGIAAARLIWFDLIVHNPLLEAQRVGPVPLLNLVTPAFLGGAFFLYRAWRNAAGGAARLWLALFLASLIAGTALLVRQLFQGPILNGPAMPVTEAYAYSLAGLLLSVALLVGGVRSGDKPLRVAGLALLTLTIAKVFLIDAAALEGLLRILSFLGLGIALIGVGKLYGTILSGPKAATSEP